MRKFEILLVEDEENLHDALKLNLEMEGYSVSSSYDGAHALKQIQSAHFDLIILDIMLPSLDGFAITETVRLHNIETPILILSAKNTSTNRVQGLKLGADDYLTKPFNLEELLLRVAKLIQKTNTAKQTAAIDEYSFAGHTLNFKLLEATSNNGPSVRIIQ